MSEEFDNATVSDTGGFDFESILGVSSHLQLPDEDPFADWADPFGEEESGELDQGEHTSINLFWVEINCYVSHRNCL